MSKLQLLDSDSDDDDKKLSVNKDYADRYENWRRKEELQKLKDKHGDVSLDQESDSGQSSESDSEGVEDWSEEQEKEFLRALSALKSKDPRIYDNSADFFTQSTSGGGPEKEAKPEPMFLKDYERKVVVERSGKYDDEVDGDSDDSDAAMTYAQQQRKLIKSFNVNLEDGQELLTERVKTTQQQEAEEADYRKWLRGQKTQTDKEDEKQLGALKQFWNDPQLNEEEKFLRDYVLGEGHKDDEQEDRIPSYDEIVYDPVPLEEEEEQLEKEEQFERKYNFRFEEPDTEFIKAYPRKIDDSLRRKDEKRREKRDIVKERKLKEKQQKKDEIKQLKNLKRKEILDKVEKLRKISGNKSLTLDPDQLDKDFDPADYDKQMQKLFDDQYYAQEEADEKPEFSDSDADQDANWDEWRSDGQNDQHRQDHQQPEPSTSTFARVVSTKKPLFNPQEKTFEEYLSEYYKLNYEDLIGDMPCRFKYRQVQQNDFGLDVNEIFTADDKELNSWVSLRKMSQYRDDNEEKFDVISYKRKAENVGKKKSILQTVYKSKQTEDAVENPGKNKKRKRKTEAATKKVVAPKVAPETTPSPKISADQDQTQTPAGGRKRKRKQPNEQRQATAPSSGGKKKQKLQKEQKATGNATDYVSGMSDERLRAYGMNPKRVKNKIKYKNKAKTD